MITEQNYAIFYKFKLTYSSKNLYYHMVLSLLLADIRGSVDSNNKISTTKITHVKTVIMVISEAMQSMIKFI